MAEAIFPRTPEGRPLQARVLALVLCSVWGFVCGRWAHRATDAGLSAGLWTGIGAFALGALLTLVGWTIIAPRVSPAGFQAARPLLTARWALSALLGYAFLIVPPIFGAWYTARPARSAPEASPDA